MRSLPHLSILAHKACRFWGHAQTCARSTDSMRQSSRMLSTQAVGGVDGEESHKWVRDHPLMSMIIQSALLDRIGHMHLMYTSSRGRYCFQIFIHILKLWSAQESPSNCGDEVSVLSLAWRCGPAIDSGLLGLKPDAQRTSSQDQVKLSCQEAVWQPDTTCCTHSFAAQGSVGQHTVSLRHLNDLLSTTYPSVLGRGVIQAKLEVGFSYFYWPVYGYDSKPCSRFLSEVTHRLCDSNVK